MQAEERDLLRKYREGACSEAEKALVEGWYLRFNEDGVGLSDKRLRELGKEIYTQLPGSKGRSSVKLWVGKMAAAAAIIAIVGGTLLYFSPGEAPKVNHTTSTTPVANQAVLTLADGKEIMLDSSETGLLASQNGLEIIKVSDGRLAYKITDPQINVTAVGYSTISVPNGGQYEISLSDDSKVWLNAATSLKVPIAFAKSKARRVTLSGEAYFEVFKDKARPFIVQTAFEDIKVLGTRFNVSAYNADAFTKTSLLEGAVELSSRGSGNAPKVRLKPNQEAINDGTGFSVQSADPEIAISWKNGEFMFRNEPLQNIMAKVARWYDMEVVYQDKAVGKERFGGSISRSASLAEVLELLEMTGDVHFSVEGKKIKISK
ncbi:FecR family protein [Pedobacter faecalis]|uniref:FecR family protein n=1 Tax=Pedobacter faecalis TaxID=3041495 RepID=UPI00254C1C6B|nr:FecR domain-containing protein [Pedobacter sp. ELA7]